MGLHYGCITSEGKETPKTLSQFPVSVWNWYEEGKKKKVPVFEMFFRPKTCSELWNLNVRTGRDLSDNVTGLFYTIKILNSKSYN